MSVRGGRAARPTAGRSADPAVRLAVVVALLALLAGCRAVPEGTGSSDSGSAAAAPTAGDAPIPDRDRAAMQATLDAVNATAGGPVAAQQAELLSRTDPGRRSDVERCPAATTTVRFEPVDHGLRAAPGTPSESAAPGTPDESAAGGGPGDAVYLWPALIRIYAGDRQVGTDLTTLQMVVRSGGPGVEAYLTPFCVN